MGDVASVDKEALRSAHTSASELRGEVLSGPERRRRWSAEEKLRVLAQSVAPGSSPTSSMSRSSGSRRNAAACHRSSELTKAMRYALTRWDALTLYTKDGRIGIDNNPAERSLAQLSRLVAKLG